MELFNDGWEFCKQTLFSSFEEMQKQKDKFHPVGIPHDWMIYQVDNLYEDATGWYRKVFLWEKKEHRKVFLRFDGIYMDSCIYVNGIVAGEWKYGYSSFEVDITEYLKDKENEIWVSVTYQAPNSRWYTGAGIYRNVWIKELATSYIAADGIYFSAVRKEKNVWTVNADVELIQEEKTVKRNLKVCCFLYPKTDIDKKVLLGEQLVLTGEEDEQTISMQAEIDNPLIWDIDSPSCYELLTQLKDGEFVLQEEKRTVGFRMFDFSPERGFSLNGRKVKLNGVCEHHDLGCLGAAFHKKAMQRKFKQLKDMGVNAVRLAHNMPAPEVMELADEMGILIVTESFDIWTSPKTPYDYARFFKTWYERDIRNWVKRDRNHPSLLMWSIGNEIYDTHVSEEGQTWCRILMQEVLKYDPRKNANITLASNYLPWENARKCADIVKYVGYNYGEKYYDDHHKMYKDWIIYGSETGSVVQSRGIYHFPYRQSILTDEDEQCSSLGNSPTSWGAASAEACLKAEIDHPYSCGQFVWSGFDFIGEPTPYHTRNSYFGQIDTAGFPKDTYYIYQSGWVDYKKKPMVHIFPYWDFNDGQLIDVRVCSNAPKVELFLNGISRGVCVLDQKGGTSFAGLWQIPYEPGELLAVACDEDGTMLATDTCHSFNEPESVCLKASETQLFADGEDLLFVEISMEDADGYPVENANNRVYIRVSGAGALVGTDNGDSTDTEPYKSGCRKLFSGKLLAVCKAGKVPGTLCVQVDSPGVKGQKLCIPVVSAQVREGISECAYLAGEETTSADRQDDIEVRKILLTSSKGVRLNKENPQTTVSAKLCPQNVKDREVEWSIVDDAGIPVKIARIETDGLTAKVTAVSDGSFRLRCMSKSGTRKIRIISSLEFTVSGFGKAFTDPYDFVSAGLFDYSRGEIGNGNEHGVAMARDGESQVGFHNIDFGKYGSDEIIMPVFALTDDPYEFQIYEGMPGEGGTLIGDFVYQKPKIWNVYQEAVYKLQKRLRGVTEICFVFHAKVHLKGFRFKEYNRAWQKLLAGECDQIYGDSFRRDGQYICGIGNNVTIQFCGLDFADEGVQQVTICGRTPLEKNAILLKFAENGNEEQRMVEFCGGKESQTFSFEPVYGRWDVSLVFLPGCQFDFYSIQFIEKQP